MLTPPAFSERDWAHKYCQRKGRAALLGSAAVSLWLSKSLVRAVRDRLVEGPSGPIAVLNLPSMRRALQQMGCQVEEIPSEGRASLAALIVGGVASAEGGEELARHRAQLMPGGQLLAIDKGKPTRVSSMLLCAGLSDLRQISVSRRLLTCAFLPLR